jgi:hypothetical protein
MIVWHNGQHPFKHHVRTLDLSFSSWVTKVSVPINIIFICYLSREGIENGVMGRRVV